MIIYLFWYLVLHYMGFLIMSTAKRLVALINVPFLFSSNFHHDVMTVLNGELVKSEITPLVSY